MSNFISSPTIQEIAANFAATVLATVNSAASETAGVDVLWFRAVPDKRNQDVIFQSYTLYGVEDCPLEFRALYSDTGYDDAAITYNIMGLNFAIPMTLDIALKTWKEASGDDGTIPQEHDIVFIPMTRKLMEVVSMTPVKQLGGQLTSYKVNLSIYKPTRSRIVGENLKESISESTTNLKEKFGEDIERNIKDIVDPDQLDIYTSTTQDKQKTVTPERSEDSIMLDIRNIMIYDLIVDGHTVARNYYNMQSSSNIVVKYNRHDHFVSGEDERCLSLWVRLHNTHNVSKNVKSVEKIIDGNDIILITPLGKDFNIGDEVIFERGTISVPGTVVSKNRILMDNVTFKKMDDINPMWYNMPGFTITKGNPVNFISGDNFEITLRNGNVLIFKSGNDTKTIIIPNKLKDMLWYGIIINISDSITVDIYSTEDVFSKMEHLSYKNDTFTLLASETLYIKSSDADITNIRYYSVANTEMDKQITDLLSYNAANDSYAIINDSADTYINKPYISRQR